MIAREDVYRIGRIGKTHGVKGEVTLQFDDDIFDRTDAEYLVLDIDGILVPFFMEEYRFRSDSLCLMKFCDIDTQQRAQELTGCEVFFPRSVAAADDDSLSLSSLIGYTLLAAPTASDASHAGTPSAPTVPDGSAIGTIASIDATTANTLFVLDNGTLIPASADLTTAVDHRRRTITMRLPDGILEL